MKLSMRAAAALAGSAVVALMAFSAAPAFAGECDDGCGPIGPQLPPPLPGIPAAVNSTGSYFVALGTIQNQQYQQGYYQNGQTTYFGGGPYHPIGGDGRTLSVGGALNNITLQPTLDPLAAVRVTATALTPQDPNFPGFDIVARGSLSLGYLVTLHANTQAAADALTAMIGVDGGIAHVEGQYSLTATGASWGSVSATTGTGAGASLVDSFSRACSLINYGGAPGGCDAGGYNLGLNFANGLEFAGGNGLDFYSAITLSASANAGPPNLGYYPGTLDAYIDPQIFFNAGLDLSQYSLSVGGVNAPLVPTAGGVPEPAAWAMLLLGFGGIGAAMRRARRPGFRHPTQARV